MRVMLEVLALLSLTTYCYGWAGYQERIPNGDSVPHPCKDNNIWKGVGHLNQAGGGSNNQFGLDFKAAGHEWTKNLCMKDSDNDGKTNGAELGDVDCTWAKGTVPKSLKEITHPGICDPWDSEECKKKNEWVSCESEEFNCPAIKEEGVMTMDFRFPPTTVPAKMTTYICMTYDLPKDDDYHIIATTPIINNTRVMHHLLLFGCHKEIAVTSEPKECNMGGCSSIIGAWTIGSSGECLFNNTGVLIGKNSMNKAVMQMHWTNPEEKEDFVDSSGIRIYYTRKLRKYDAATYSTGQLYLEIPPLSPKVVQQSTCSSKCTNKHLNGSIFLTVGTNHMHYLGIAGAVKLKRQDGSELMLTNDQPYSYDTPVFLQYDPPIEVRPGDELVTSCTYRSMSRQKTAMFGEGSFEEMCFSFFTFFPAHAINPDDLTCYTQKDVDLCDYKEWNCKSFLNIAHPETSEMIDKVMETCSYTECRIGCRKLTDEIFKTNRCLNQGRKDAMLKFLMNTYDRIGNDTLTLKVFKFVSALRSCEIGTENPIVGTEEFDTNAKVGEVYYKTVQVVPPVKDGGSTFTLSILLVATIIFRLLN